MLGYFYTFWRKQPCFLFTVCFCPSWLTWQSASPLTSVEIWRFMSSDSDWRRTVQAAVFHYWVQGFQRWKDVASTFEMVDCGYLWNIWTVKSCWHIITPPFRSTQRILNVSAAVIWMPWLLTSLLLVDIWFDHLVMIFFPLAVESNTEDIEWICRNWMPATTSSFQDVFLFANNDFLSIHHQKYRFARFDMKNMNSSRERCWYIITSLLSPQQRILNGFVAFILV